jgi:transposase
MAGIYQLKIRETEIELKQLLRKEKTGSGKERIQLLYLLKSQKAKTISQASELLGRHRVTLQDWLAKYRKGGLESLLGRAISPGRPRKIPTWAVQALAKRLKQEEGFESYSAICQWLQTNLGITAKYKTVHSLVYYRLKASPKIARPQSLEQSTERLEAFKKTSSII